jgi:hypothetical protein
LVLSGQRSIAGDVALEQSRLAVRMQPVLQPTRNDAADPVDPVLQ